MKLRLNYVSNSSSSSSIIISDKGKNMTAVITSMFSKLHGEPLKVPNKDAKYFFGWEFEDTPNFRGKLNFCAIQLLYIRERFLNDQELRLDKPFDEYYDMLRSVCKDEFGFEVELDFDLIKPSAYCKGEYLDSDYSIDHQSSVEEGKCFEMFDSYDSLYKFLAYDSSYIHGGNDNE